LGHRIEKDFLGEKNIPDDAYYGIQTLRGKENFHITGVPMSREPCFVKAFGYVKKAAVLANRDLGVLDAKVTDAIAWACDRLIAGEFADQFVTTKIGKYVLNHSFMIPGLVATTGAVATGLLLAKAMF
jgi:aspartate ammonia-lyase